MDQLIHNAVDIYRQDGALEVLTRGVDRIRRRYLADVRLRLVPPLPPVRVNYSVGGVIARFAVTSPCELRRFLSPGGITEAPVHRELVERLGPDDVFYDVGANVGIYSCIAGAAVAEGNGRVLAFEPLPSNVESVERNATLNPGPVDVFDIALSDENATRMFDMYRDGTAGEGQGRLAPDDGSDGTSFSVKTRRGDDFIQENELSPPTAVKIDVEGAEMSVIRGIRGLLSSETCRLVYCEVHDPVRGENADVRDFDDEPDNVRETLERMGYQVTRVLTRDTPVQKGYVLRGERLA